MIIKFPDYVKNMVEVDGKLYNYSKSDNGQYLIVWRDIDEELNSGRGGPRKKGHGKIILFYNDQKIYETLDFERPRRAFVTNDGIVAIIDILFGDRLRGDFVILDKFGYILVKYRAKANIVYDKDTFGLTEDGKHGWFSTAQSSNSDSNKGFIFDIINNKVIKRSSLIWRLKGLCISPNGEISNL